MYVIKKAYFETETPHVIENINVVIMQIKGHRADNRHLVVKTKLLRIMTTCVAMSFNLHNYRRCEQISKSVYLSIYKIIIKSFSCIQEVSQDQPPK